MDPPPINLGNLEDSPTTSPALMDKSPRGAAGL